MGIYLNPGNDNFKGTLRSDIYVDKTMMIDVINRFIDKENKYICISRPRRFGKTIAGNMLAAYYSKGCASADLFKGLKIVKTKSFREKLNHYNVIQIDMNDEYQNADNKMAIMTTGKGYADVVYVPVSPDIPAMVIELKHNRSADSAIKQIKDKKYYTSLEHYSGNLLFVGISYDEKKKTHTCRIERFVKDVR